MAAKNWVDAEDFAEALRIARAKHAPRNPNRPNWPIYRSNAG
jgi:hypothetical protein